MNRIEAQRAGTLGLSSFALTREVGVGLNAMSDIANKHKGRPAMTCRKREGIVLGLMARRYHELVPCSVRASLLIPV